MTASMTDLFTEHLTSETAGECPQLLVISCFHPFHDFDTSTSTFTSTSTSASTRVRALVPVHAVHWSTGVHWCVLVYCCMAASQESCQPGVMPARSHASQESCQPAASRRVKLGYVGDEQGLKSLYILL